jgi:hypothetical protein
MIVYAGELDQYAAFMATESYFSWMDWMDCRASYGERITPDS